MCTVSQRKDVMYESRQNTRCGETMAKVLITDSRAQLDHIQYKIKHFRAIGLLTRDMGKVFWDFTTSLWSPIKSVAGGAAKLGSGQGVWLWMVGSWLGVISSSRALTARAATRDPTMLLICALRCKLALYTPESVVVVAVKVLPDCIEFYLT